MKRKQKSYNTEQSLIMEIDALKAKQTALLAQAEQKEADGKRFIRTGNVPDVATGEWLMKQAGIARRGIDRAEGRLTKFKEALAAFRTEMLPLGQGKFDKQVVLK
jgi:hypothetical protein